MKNIVRLMCFFLVIFLYTGQVFAAEKVYFYHTAPAGTPIAISDSTGNVVWRADLTYMLDKIKEAKQHAADNTS